MKAILRITLFVTLTGSLFGCQPNEPSRPIQHASPSQDFPIRESNDRPAQPNSQQMLAGGDDSQASPAQSPEPPTPAPAPIVSLKPRPKAKGIYVSGWAAGTAKINRLIELVDATELNAMVIDVKNDNGQVTFRSNVPLVHEVGADSKVMVPDIRRLLSRLKEKQIYTIARVVTFKDPSLAIHRNDWAMQTKTGDVWYDNRGIAWVDPHRQEVWDYAIDIAKEAAELGFDEIQFDYVRFPENGEKVEREVAFHNPNGWSKSETIRRFLNRARTKLKPKGVYVSADVFGLTTSTPHDMGIGQQWSELAQEVDVISPMIYPSHYGNGAMGIKHPDLQPYVTVQKAISAGLHKNEALAKQNVTPAAIRPWLQDFTAAWVKPHKAYGSEDVRAQIQAARELGVDEYLLWNSNCTYTFR